MRFLIVTLVSISLAWGCSPQLRQIEKQYGVPDYLLCAIASVESGDGQGSTRPWVINANGQGMTFATKEAAIAQVRTLKSSGVSSIDVGMMQINLKHHPEAFQNLDEAFDPATNMRYAANFIIKLKNELGSWREAIGHYHSATPERNGPYKTKVLRAWAEFLMHAVDGSQPQQKPTVRKTKLSPLPKHMPQKPSQVPMQAQPQSPTIPAKAAIPAAPGRFISVNNVQPYADVKTTRFAVPTQAAQASPTVNRSNDGFITVR